MIIPRLHISFPYKHQLAFWCGVEHTPQTGEYLLNHARSGIVMALRAALPNGGRVGVVAYNCHTVANAVEQSGCTPVFVDVTDDLHIDLQHLSTLQLDALVLTNLFGIHNDITAVRQTIGAATIIVDNAHGYGLPVEGDFTVYSINQGKLPALGEGGLLWVNNAIYQAIVEQQYAVLPRYSRTQELKLFISMLMKAWMHIPWVYGLLTLRMKAHRGKVECREHVVLRQMAKGISRMYLQALPSINQQIQQQLTNAQYITNTLIDKQLVDQVWCGNNAFMLIARTKDTIGLSKYLADHGVESATHFAHAIEWAKEFGYTEGQCPMAERLTKELIMIPTYVRYNL